MAPGGKQRDTRAERERARVYQARRAFHEGRARRRTRDNLIAGIGGAVLILAVIAGQAAYFMSGPGAPTPTPSSSTSPAPTSTPAPGGSPAVTPAPSDSSVPVPTPTTAP
ncbi:MULTISPECIES: dioxygenase [unclassified Microbacterium]|uniref:dioxygenase n=1 Tax=unclassified Microbacterium TaxID=2609290 RepID=UPI00214C1321|nr:MULTISPECIES: dioxygenase [unclassified Microbacterium]MCR2811050.1 dioxygenase [Microbacterium sp. zg.B185]WIM17697.1 dioxygenase [Microbacterium sp. zg-B185]